jgi:hypothetical protein
MDTRTIDAVLAQVYQAFDVPLDHFFGDAALTQTLTGRVRERLPACQLSTNELMARLLNLRKRGRLPRLRRAYFGRGATVATD